MSMTQGNLNIKLLSNEKIYTIQRKHFILIAFPLASYALIAIICIVAFIIISRIFPTINPLSFIDVALLLLSFLVVFDMFIIMNWFYQFYVVTNKRILHIHFFKTQGKHFEEVFVAAGTEIKISRVASNLIYGIFNVEDIYIEFRQQDREAPFIIRTPDHPEKLEQILDEIATDHEKER
jgi:hypothetical protein